MIFPGKFKFPGRFSSKSSIFTAFYFPTHKTLLTGMLCTKYTNVKVQQGFPGIPAKCVNLDFTKCFNYVSLHKVISTCHVFNTQEEKCFHKLVFQLDTNKHATVTPYILGYCIPLRHNMGLRSFIKSLNGPIKSINKFWIFMRRTEMKYLCTVKMFINTSISNEKLYKTELVL